LADAQPRGLMSPTDICFLSRPSHSCRFVIALRLGQYQVLGAILHKSHIVNFVGGMLARFAGDVCTSLKLIRGSIIHSLKLGVHIIQCIKFWEAQCKVSGADHTELICNVR
jgi:hypothetical protein